MVQVFQSETSVFIRPAYGHRAPVRRRMAGISSQVGCELIHRPPDAKLVP